MSRLPFLLLAALALPSAAFAGTISSATCTNSSTSTGCITSYVPSYPAVSFQVTGNWVGSLVFEGSNDGVTFVPLRGYPVAGGAYVSGISSNGAWTVSTGGLVYVRVRAASWSSGTASVIPQASSSPVAADVVRAVGSTFGEVAISGAVELGATSLSSLTAPTCTLPSAPPVVTLTSTPQDVPATPLAGRSQALIINHSSTQRVWCCIGTGCTPTSTAAYILEPSGGSRTLSVRDSVPIRCRSAAGTADVGVEESSCG